MRLDLFLLRSADYAPVVQLKVLKFLPAKLAEFIFENFYSELNLAMMQGPLNLQDRSVQLYDFILHECVVREDDGTQLQTFGMIQFENKKYFGQPKARCYPFKKFHGKNLQVLNCLFDCLCIVFVLSLYCLLIVFMTPGLHGNHSSESVP
jgi:hypothetical protein